MEVQTWTVTAAILSWDEDLTHRGHEFTAGRYTDANEAAQKIDDLYEDLQGQINEVGGYAVVHILGAPTEYPPKLLRVNSKIIVPRVERGKMV